MEDLGTNEHSEVSFDYIVTAIGHFDRWKLPEYPGIHRYKGTLMHSSGWNPDFDPSGRRIATIGNGASGIQCTTEIRKMAAHVDHYARSRTVSKLMGKTLLMTETFADPLAHCF